MGIVVAWAPGGLEHDDGADIEHIAGACFEQVNQTGVSGFHERREQQIGVSVEPEPKEVGDG